MRRSPILRQIAELGLDPSVAYIPDGSGKLVPKNKSDRHPEKSEKLDLKEDQDVKNLEENLSEDAKDQDTEKVVVAKKKTSKKKEEVKE